MNKEQKEIEKQIQKITNHLLRNDKTAEDVFNDIFWGKEGQSYMDAMNNRKEVSEASHINLYGTLFDTEMLEYWCSSVDAPASVYTMTLPLVVSMSDIESDLKQYLGKSWKQLSYEQKLDVLWEYGLNVKAGMDEASKYVINRQIHRNRKNKTVDGLVVIASERLDKEWLSNPLASFEAKTFTTDAALSRELTGMSRYS